MTEENKSQTLVETHKAVAAGIASMVTALLTSRLGVAGTLIGTAVSATLITLISAVLKAQLLKASDTISGLPSAVQGRLPTQQLRIPGKPGPEPNPEPAAQPKAAKGGRLSGLLSRLRALPGFLRGLPSVQRRKVLIAGVLAGLMATLVGLIAVTGVEFVGGNTLSCLVWSCPQDETASAKSSGHSGLSILGGYSLSGYYSSLDTQSTPSHNPSGAQPFVPESGQQVPQQRQPAGQPAQPNPNEGVPQQQQQPDEKPGSADQVRQQPDSGPGPGEEGQDFASPSDKQQNPSQRGQVQEKGAKKEDRG